MPPRIDRTTRRRQVVDAYLTLVARDGIVTASTRALAAEMGVSTGSLWHWFDDVDEVLQEAFELVFQRTDERIAQARSGLRGLPALAATLGEILPLTKETTDEARVVVAFWGRAASSAALVTIHQRVMRGWLSEFVAHLDEARDDGTLLQDTPVALVADLLLVLILGHQAGRVLDEPAARPGRQWELVHGVLQPWAVAALTGLPGLPRGRSSR